MTIDRRTFIQCAGVAAATPVFAALLPLSPSAKASPLSRSSLAQDATNADSTVFKIDGWDDCNRELLTGSEVSIRINQSWRAAWAELISCSMSGARRPPE
jgi:hypothetical protein